MVVHENLQNTTFQAMIFGHTFSSTCTEISQESGPREDGVITGLPGRSHYSGAESSNPPRPT